MGPECRAMLFCESVLTDRIGKRYIIGEFAGLLIEEFPLVMPMFTVYLVLSGGRGIMPIHLRAVCMDSDEVLIEADGEARFETALVVARSWIEMPGIEFPRAGTYSFVVQCGELCAERKLELVRA